jgi:hypothetical protein
MASNRYKTCQNGSALGPASDGTAYNKTPTAATSCELDCCASRDARGEAREREKKTVEPCTECDGIGGKFDKRCCDSKPTLIDLVPLSL